MAAIECNRKGEGNPIGRQPGLPAECLPETTIAGRLAPNKKKARHWVPGLKSLGEDA